MNRYLKVAVLATVSLGTLFILISLVSSHWITTNRQSDFIHMGLWRGCSSSACVRLVGGGYTKAFLIIAFIFGIVCILLASGTLYLESQGPITILKSVAWTIASTAFLQMIGMSFGTVLFQFDRNFEHFSWGFSLGWIAGILCVVSAVICGIDHRLEPKEAEPLMAPPVISEVGAGIGPQADIQGEPKPPPYSPPQGAILPYPGPQGAFQIYPGPPMGNQPQPGPQAVYQPQPGYQPPPAS